MYPNGFLDQIYQASALNSYAFLFIWEVDVIEILCVGRKQNNQKEDSRACGARDALEVHRGVPAEEDQE